MVEVAALGSLTGVVAVANWWSVATSRFTVEWWTKLLTMVALLATAIGAGALSTTPGRWLLVALFFGLLGDLALLGDTVPRFLSGVAAFLVGHLAYVACFATLGLPSPAWAWAGVAVLAVILFASRRVVPSAWRVAGPSVAVPLAAYSLVIGAMLVIAWLTGLWAVAAGATIFVISDTIIALALARDGFERPRGSDHVAVMVTYHVGQALIVAGVLLAAG